MKGKIRVKKSERDLYYAVKTIKAVGEDALPMLVQKREDNKKKKKNPSKTVRNDGFFFLWVLCRDFGFEFILRAFGSQHRSL